jgi:hypothetical protein
VCSEGFCSAVIRNRNAVIEPVNMASVPSKSPENMLRAKVPIE